MQKSPIWDTGSMEALMTIQAHTGKVVAAAFSPDGSTIATGSTDGSLKIWDPASSLKIWDPASGQNILSLPEIEGGVTGLVFSPDGKRLYAAGGDGTVQVFLIDAGELIALAKSRVTRSLTQEECQAYLNLETCP